MRFHTFLSYVVLSTLSFTSIAADHSSHKAGRYISVNPSATPVQNDLLSVVIDVSFGPGITTVHDALRHILLRSGYRLAGLSSSDPFLPILLSRPLPHVHRHLGPITLKDALTTLAGSSWALAIDPVNRLISYELLAEYRPVSDSPDNVISKR